MSIYIPLIKKPFPDYKWRWMEVTPVESFNRPDILLGVTRAIEACEGKTASSQDFISKLEKIQDDLLSDSGITLVPNDPQRNVLRRQGRYWRGLGLLDQRSTRSLKLTTFGSDYAKGRISDDDFAASIISSHQLPNGLIDQESTIDLWKRHNLTIRPLKIILETLTYLEENHGPEVAYLKPVELAKVIIPLVLHSTDASLLGRAVLEFRVNPAIFTNLPDCTPESNDKRMVREHLLFLYYYGILRKENAASRNNEQEKYYLGDVDVETIKDIVTEKGASSTQPNLVTSIPIRFAPSAMRTRRMVEVTSRPNQSQFRKALLANFAGRCLITGEVVSDVLIACHIHEVKDGGSDNSDNGVILRADLHILFDKNKLRISSEGNIIFSPDISTDSQYQILPRKVTLPLSVNRELLRRRFEYGRVILPESGV
jgi:hypothetical protein